MLTCISNWDKMYAAEAKVRKDNGVSSRNELYVS